MLPPVSMTWLFVVVRSEAQRRATQQKPAKIHVMVREANHLAVSAMPGNETW
jgi:hypothetical protein